MFNVKFERLHLLSAVVNTWEHARSRLIILTGFHGEKSQKHSENIQLLCDISQKNRQGQLKCKVI